MVLLLFGALAVLVGVFGVLFGVLGVLFQVLGVLVGGRGCLAFGQRNRNHQPLWRHIFANFRNKIIVLYYCIKLVFFFLLKSSPKANLCFLCGKKYAGLKKVLVWRW